VAVVAVVAVVVLVLVLVLVLADPASQQFAPSMQRDIDCDCHRILDTNGPPCEAGTRFDPDS